MCDMYSRLQMHFNHFEKDDTEKIFELADSIWQKAKKLYKDAVSGEYDVKPEIADKINEIVKLADELKETVRNIKNKRKI